MARIDDSGEFGSLDDSRHEHFVELIIGNHAGAFCVQGDERLREPIGLATCSIAHLPPVARVVKEKGIARLGTSTGADEPLHRLLYVPPCRSSLWVGLIVGERQNRARWVRILGLEQICHALDIVDAPIELAALALVVYADEKGASRPARMSALMKLRMILLLLRRTLLLWRILLLLRILLLWRILLLLRILLLWRILLLLRILLLWRILMRLMLLRLSLPTTSSGKFCARRLFELLGQVVEHRASADFQAFGKVSHTQTHTVRAPTRSSHVT